MAARWPAAGLEETAEECGRTGQVYLARPAQETPSTRRRSSAQTRVREGWREGGRVCGSGRSVPPVRGLDRTREISGGKRKDDDPDD